MTWGGKRFYFAGDAKDIPEMRVVKAFKPRIVYPYHYRGTDLSVFEKALAGTGIEVRLREWYK